MNEPILTLGAFYVTPFSIAVFIGVLLSACLLLFLARKSKVTAETTLTLTMLSILFGLLLGHAFFAALQLYTDPFSYEEQLAFLLNPGWGGFSFVGVLGGAVLAAIITAKACRQPFETIISILIPALMFLIAVIRFAEPLDELGKGPEASATFFPFSYAPNPEYDDAQRIPVFFYEGLLALCIAFLGSLDTKSLKRMPWQGCLLVFFAGQMFFEVFRQDLYTNYMSLITFIRVNQLAYVNIIACIMLKYTIRAASQPANRLKIIRDWIVFAVCVGACVGLQFLFDKPIHFFEENIFLPDWWR